MSGPKGASSSSNAPEVQPDAFDIPPNVARLGGAWVTEWCFSRCTQHSNSKLTCFPPRARLLKALQGKKEAELYIQRARRRIVHVSAARAWSLGVPWAQALSIAEKAVAAGDAVVPNGFSSKGAAKGKGKGRGKGKGKGKGRGK